MLPFDSPAHIEEWSLRHGIGMGEAVPLRQVAHLARTVAEAQQIFERVGLTSDFWRLESRSGRF